MPLFNEGGADCPPKLHIRAQMRPRLQSFNEGGADCPPKLCCQAEFQATTQLLQ